MILIEKTGDKGQLRNLVDPVEFGVPRRHLSGDVRLATGERLGCTTPGLEGSLWVSLQ